MQGNQVWAPSGSSLMALAPFDTIHPMGIETRPRENAPGFGTPAYGTRAENEDPTATGVGSRVSNFPVDEVVNLLSAQRGYEANASAVDTVKTMAQRALDIMR